MVFNTMCNVRLFDDGKAETYKKIFDRLIEIEAEFDVHKPLSQLGLVNQNAGIKPVKVSAEVFDVVEKCLEFAFLSDGTFNPAMGPVINLWGITGSNPRVPGEEEVEKALRSCDFGKVIMDRDAMTIYLEEGMALDLGAAVKGYACDEVTKILVQEKVKCAVLDFGGNIVVFGQKPDGSAWKVGIKNPAAPGGDPVKVLEISPEQVKKSGYVSIVTSGGYERYFEQDGKRYHHIFDSKTGYPSESNVSSATVVCSSSFMADVLSTLYFVTGKTADDQKKFNSIEEDFEVYFTMK